MKPIYTTICAVIFFISGILVTLNNNAIWYRNKAQAAQPVVSYIDPQSLPLDLQLDLANRRSNVKVFCDTIHDTIPLEVRHDTVPVVKYKYRTRVQKLVEPDSLPRRADTLYVPVVQIQVPLVKEEAKDSHKHYIHVVDTICNGVPNSIR